MLPFQETGALEIAIVNITTRGVAAENQPILHHGKPLLQNKLACILSAPLKRNAETRLYLVAKR